MEEDEINLLDYWNVIKKRGRLIAFIFIASVVVTIIFSLLATSIYSAKATIMPIEPQSRISQAVANLPSFAASSLGGTTSADKMVTILKSRTLAENLMARTGLAKILFRDSWDEKRNRWRKKPPSLQKTTEALQGITKIDKGVKEGIITIRVEYKDPRLAAFIANQYVIELQKFINENALSLAKRNRIFIENQLKEIKGELTGTEDSLASFQSEKKMASLDAQTQASISALAGLKGQITAKEVELGVMRQYSTANNPDVLKVQDELRELRKQLQSVEAKKSNPGSNPLPSLTDAPRVGLDFLRLKRNAQSREELYKILSQQYEMAKIDEAKEDITFQVLDYAIPPEQRIKPKRRQNVMIGGITSLFAGIFLSFFMEYVEKMRGGEKNTTPKRVRKKPLKLD